ncbi:MAG: hypothetical protein IBJ07_12360 [Rhizobiaceae bacterium]|nr:hypothetical protein [Rhizobiaceae bacterium]
MSVQKAAKWLATTPDDEKPHPIIPHLRKSFDLTPLQAVEAIREAELIKARSI